MSVAVPAERDRAITRALLAWFRASARELPWRSRPLGSGRDAYRVLVSELMLQQTQASRVVDRFGAFLDRFPTLEALAAADEGDVLALWSGLGYYRRARLLHEAARAIVRDHGGRFPRTASDLAGLPGLGRYTAGAIASLAFGEKTAAVDANVTRVMLRLEGRVLAAGDARAVRLAWDRAGALLEAGPRRRGAPALVNEALIELGALVCTPRAPRCGSCPLAGQCRAAARGLAGRIPTAKEGVVRTRLHFASVLIADGEGRLAVRRRGTGGLWGGLYEAPTVERADRAATVSEIAGALGLGRGRPAAVGGFDFRTTHRECRFEVYRARRPRVTPEGWAFLDRERIAALGLSSPQRRILLELSRGG